MNLKVTHLITTLVEITALEDHLETPSIHHENTRHDQMFRTELQGLLCSSPGAIQGTFTSVMC